MAVHDESPQAMPQSTPEGASPGGGGGSPSKAHSLQLFMHAASSAPPSFVAGYAYGLSQAHQQALLQIQTVNQSLGAVESSARRCQEENERLSSRIRNTELLLACTAGRHNNAISTIEERLRGFEVDGRLWEGRIMGLEGRLSEAERRSVPAVVLRLLSASLRQAISSTVAVAAFVRGYEGRETKRGLAGFAAVWLAVEVVNAMKFAKKTPTLVRAWLRLMRIMCWAAAILVGRSAYMRWCAAQRREALAKPPNPHDIV